MIQRVQSIWLLLAAVGAFAGFSLPFFSGNIIEPDKAKTFQHLVATNNIGILLLTGLVGALALVALFLYKNRPLQLRLSFAGCILSVINIILYYLQTQKFVAGEGSYNITAIVTLLVPVFFLLAARGISKDQKLVKSLDRLR
jgi:hypothetical protein